jgi:aminoglycoside/choline kinase family phosphotransferase
MDKIKSYLQTTPYKDFEISLASADASFRKYYRLTLGEKTFLLMDSSLELNSLRPFLNVTQRLINVKVQAPQIFEQNLEDGYLILEDFGSTHYLDVLNKENFVGLYKNAIDLIIKMQNASTQELPLYDKDFLILEMNLMQEWYLEGLLKKTLTSKERELIAETLEKITQVVLSQPQDFFVHRDFHSRNIMITQENEIGLIDFQDAMSGAITYDLVSLLKDCYIEFDEEEIQQLALYFRDKKGLDASDEEFIKWFDFMGLQRHIKVLGVFSRLFLRDKKDGYLKDMPLVLKYVFDTAKKYDETKEFALFLKEL